MPLKYHGSALIGLPSMSGEYSKGYVHVGTLNHNVLKSCATITKEQ
jgi:hypothetical protein